MGFAILIIVFYHFTGRGGTELIDKLAGLGFSQGYVGVDIFMIVSGLGLTFSMSKNESLKDYYIKRWIRIFPIFTFITLIECWIIRGESFGLALFRSTTIGFWCGLPSIDWYVPSIVLLYVIYPLIFHYLIKPKRYKVLWLFIFGFILISVCINLFFNQIIDWKHYCFLYRIPDFLLGCLIGSALLNGYKTENVKKLLVIYTSLAIVSFITLHNTPYWLWITNLFLTPLYLLILCNIFRLLSSSIKTTKVVSIFSFMGLFTLEWYRISSSFERLLTNDTCPEYHFLFVLLYAVLSFALSYITYLAFKRINNKLYAILSMIFKTKHL